MDNNFDEETEVLDDLKVFNKTLTDIEKLESNHDKQTPIDNSHKKNVMKYLITGMLWLAFILFVTIIIYIIVNEPDIISKITDKFF